MRQYLVLFLTLPLWLALFSCQEAESTTYEGTDTESDAEAAQPITTIHFSQTLHDFGDIPEGQVVSHRFKFVNTGKHPLLVTKVRPSCGCTTPDWSKKPIPSGEEGFVEVKFDSNGRPGAVNKNVRVHANTDPEELVLAFKGEVIPKQ